MDRNIIETANRGALVDKTSTVASYLIANMADNSQQFNTRSSNSGVFYLKPLNL